MKNLKKISLTLIITVIFVTGIILPEIILGTPASPAVGNWYQQFMPNPAGGQIRDIYFIDSLTGFAVSDSSILKTTTSGDSWTVKLTGYYIFNRIKFINSVTGFASGGNNTLLKTTNSGENWTPIILPSIYPFDMSVVSDDSIWLVNSNGLTGGVYRTTNGGASWDHQLNLGSQNPVKIYMYNGSTGYITKTTGSSYIRKTTDSGISWNVIVNGEGYRDIYFADVNTGWRGWQSTVYKTTNSGINWTNQALPIGGMIITTGIESFSGLNKDTLWGVGGWIQYPNFQSRGIIYRTIDGGENWLFQVPDTNINIFLYTKIQLINKNNGWAYSGFSGIHTTSGGDPIWITGIEQISSEIPKEFMLFQNFPNPFNPVTNIKYQITNNNSFVQLIVYDITGKEIALLINKKQNSGTYQIDFSGQGYCSGVYFYKLLVTTPGKEAFSETKKMILIK